MEKKTKKIKIRIKDLPKSTNLGGIKVKTSEGRVGYWRSQWQKGVWLADFKEDSGVTPVFVDDIKEVLEWEVLTDKL